MTMKILAVLCLALVLGACESTSPDTDHKPSPAAQATQAPSPSPEATVAAPAALKAGDKVKVTINGSAVEATIISIDEKAGKASVKVAGETKERTVNLSEIVKQ